MVGDYIPQSPNNNKIANKTTATFKIVFRFLIIAYTIINNNINLIIKRISNFYPPARMVLVPSFEISSFLNSTSYFTVSITSFKASRVSPL